MARYEPDLLGGTTGDPALADYLAQELRKIAEALLNVEDILLVELNVAPKKPRDGMIILVDGTNFNPGSGRGFYGRSNGAWVLLG